MEIYAEKQPHKNDRGEDWIAFASTDKETCLCLAWGKSRSGAIGRLVLRRADLFGVKAITGDEP